MWGWALEWVLGKHNLVGGGSSGTYSLRKVFHNTRIFYLQNNHLAAWSRYLFININIRITNCLFVWIGTPVIQAEIEAIQDDAGFLFSLPPNLLVEFTRMNHQASFMQGYRQRPAL